MGWRFHDGVVRGVYRIDGWEPPTAELIAQEPQLGGRWRFWGESDPDMADRFLFTDMTEVFDQGAQNPITYIGC